LISSDNNKIRKQRAIVLGGGGALGAYEVGVLKILCKKLAEKDKEEGEDDRLLFDIIAGTSIGAMNGAVLVSQYLQRRNWQDAVEYLTKFWTEKEKGLGSTLSEEDFKKVLGWTRWHEESNKNTPVIASMEAARRYYSVKYYFFNGAPRVQEPLQPFPKPDLRFFDDQLNTWFIHNNHPLKNTILNFAKFPIATSHDKKEPRLLVFSVDVAEGKTVTFDSHPKSDGSRKSEYGRYSKEKGYEKVINYDDGINIEHIMASGTLPEFYDYQDIDGHKFWDGGLLSNTPFRELLQAYQEYWTDVMAEEDKDNISIPDLEVYIVNLHPSKQPNPPTDHDGVKDRQNDIIFGDRNSLYDERLAYLVTTLKDFTTRMKKLSEEAISKVTKESDKDELNKKFEEILATTTISKEFKGEPKRYEDLLKGRYKLSKVVRIERTNYTDSIYGKVGDFTAKTIDELIEEGANDANTALLI
jgi:NTE family protein